MYDFLWLSMTTLAEMYDFFCFNSEVTNSKTYQDFHVDKNNVKIINERITFVSKPRISFK